MSKSKEYYHNVTRQKRSEDKRNRVLVEKLKAEVLYLESRESQLLHLLEDEIKKNKALLALILERE